MKRIIKNASPPQYEVWKRGDGREASYANSGTKVRELCMPSLLREQGGLCCYTGIRIKDNSAHVEHLYSQSHSREAQTHEDLEYRNMLAAFPKTGGCAYGAMARGNTPIEVTPLDSDCETRFTFSLEGGIDCRRSTDEAASRTIKTLRLDYGNLISRRKTAIDEALFTRKMTNGEIERLKTQMQEHNRNGDYPAFCFIIEQACDSAIEIRAKLARKRRYAAQSQSSRAPRR